MRVVAITGSAGKTTTKDMVSAILKHEGGTVYSYANIDPVFNIPTTILKCRPSTKFLVLEFGVEYPGEMDFYLWMASPDVGVITNIYPTHTLYFKNEEGVAKEKTKLVKALGPNDYSVLYKQNTYLYQLRDKLKSNITWYGEQADISFSDLEFTENFTTRFVLNLGNEKISINLPVFGEQFVLNALAAAGVGNVLNVSIEKIKNGLESFGSSAHRMNIIKVKNEVVIVDDSYNNNPKAAEEFIKNISQIKSKNSILVIGEMLELGEKEINYHKELGKLISTYKFNHIIGVGNLSQYLIQELRNNNTQVKAIYVQDWREALKIVNKSISRGTTIYVKGSRSVGLNNLVDGINL